MGFENTHQHVFTIFVYFFNYLINQYNDQWIKQLGLYKIIDSSLRREEYTPFVSFYRCWKQIIMCLCVCTAVNPACHPCLLIISILHVHLCKYRRANVLNANLLPMGHVLFLFK